MFFVIFFAPASVSPAFSELERSILFRVPALVLVFRFVDEPSRFFRFSRGDIYCFALAFPALVLAGTGVSFAAARSGVFPGVPVQTPVSAAGWALAALSSLTAGSLEEGYFRVYLLERLKKAGLGIREAAAISVLLFGFCHCYEGLWGVINAAAAGLVLSILFLRFRSFYGIAFAHGFYNIAVYAFTALTQKT
ncbi:MAG: CPBP family intramembrane metalloprotease [Treponema sp.]|nr:CPBP family intramembrane metalloprotease [Treponema sp.]